MSDDIEIRLRYARFELPHSDAEIEQKALAAVLAEVPEPTARKHAQRPRLQRGWRDALAGRRRELALFAAAVVPSIAVGVVIGALLWPGPSAAVAGSSYFGPTFIPAEGWTTVTASPHGQDSCPSTRCPLAWATNVPLPASPGPFTVVGAPRAGLTDLPRDGIAIVVFVDDTLYTGPGPDPRKSWPDLDLPLTLSDFQLQRGWEGQPATNVPLYLISGWIKGRFVYARVYLGTQRPTDKMLDEANAELGRLQISDRS